MKSKTLLFIACLFMSLGASELIQAQSFSANIISQWALDETTGTTVTDKITGATGEILHEGTEWITGVKGNALDFTNADTSIIIIEEQAALQAINFTNTSFSVSVWVKFDPTEEQTLLCKGDNGADGPNGNGNRYTIQSKGGEIRFAIDDDINKTQLGVTPENYPVNEWAHIVGVRSVEEQVLILFLNGEEIGFMADATGDLNTADQRLLIGNYHNKANMCKGPIDDVLIINKALSNAEVMELYSSYASTGIEETHSAMRNISVYPNPVSDELIIRNASDFSKVEIFDISGKRVNTILSHNSETIRSSISDLPTGKYILKAYGENQLVSTASFLKK